MVAKLTTWLTEPLPKDVAAVVERLRRTKDVHHVALMPDLHLAGDVCNGTVLATQTLLYPEAVGGDIGCGIAAMRFDADADLLSDAHSAAQVLEALGQHVPAIRHRGRIPELPEHLAARPLSAPVLERRKTREGRLQLGTLGRGNHFAEFQADDMGALWLMVHSGSRAMGQAIRDWHLRRATSEQSHLAWIACDSEAGQAYLSDMAWAIDWAKLNRQRIMQAIGHVLESLFGVQHCEDSAFQCIHNFVRLEQHEERALWVHRKGALSASIDEPGMIPGSMGSPSFHVMGRGAAASLCSCSHGAGRALSRTESRRAISVRTLHAQMRGVWFDHRIAKRLCDEAPQAYKNIQTVMRAQKSLTRIVRRLKPVLSYKGT